MYVPAKTGHSIDLLMRNKYASKGLLTAEEEKRYAGLVQQLLKLQRVERSLARSLGRDPQPEEVSRLFQLDPPAYSRLKAACLEAKQRMMQCNFRLVISIAKKTVASNKSLDLNDVVAEGLEGLTRAVEKFDPTKGYKFSTYAHWWIRQSVTRFLNEHGRVIRLPVHMYEQISKIRKAQRAIRERYGREATTAEVAKLLGMEPSRVALVKQAYQDVRSLDAPLGDDSDADTLADLVTDERSEPERLEQAMQADKVQDRVKQQLEEMLAGLTDRERSILRMRYGLDDGMPKTLDEIGSMFDVSPRGRQALPSDPAPQVSAGALAPPLLSPLSPRLVPGGGPGGGGWDWCLLRFYDLAREILGQGAAPWAEARTPCRPRTRTAPCSQQPHPRLACSRPLVVLTMAHSSQATGYSRAHPADRDEGDSQDAPAREQAEPAVPLLPLPARGSQAGVREGLGTAQVQLNRPVHLPPVHLNPCALYPNPAPQRILRSSVQPHDSAPLLLSS